MRIIISLVLVSCFTLSYGQKYISKKNNIVFFSEAPIENITATNTKNTSIIDVETGKIAFSIPMVYFEFEKSLMKEHFNEQYLESDKYPKSNFVGFVEGVDFSKSGKQQSKATGKLTIHGVEKEINVEGTVEIAKKKITLESEFYVKLEDYKIKIPQLMWQNIAETIQVKILFEYEPYK